MQLSDLKKTWPNLSRGERMSIVEESHRRRTKAFNKYKEKSKSKKKKKRSKKKKKKKVKKTPEELLKLKKKMSKEEWENFKLMMDMG